MDKALFRYGLDRIARHYKLYELDGYHADISASYYGDEINEIYHDKDKEIVKAMEDFNNSENSIEFLLNLEYERVLPSLKNLKWKLESIPYEDICACSKGQTEMVKRTENPYDQSYNGPVAVCVYRGKGLHLIDGYHRFAAKEGSKEILVFVGTK